MAFKKLFLVLVVVVALCSCKDNAESEKSTLSVFDTFHTISEGMYNGDGSWGSGYPYRMALRDAYWRADVYSKLSEVASVYDARSLEAYAYLQSAQLEGGSGVFGFPADTDNPEFGETVNRIVLECPECINGGWVISLPGSHIAELYYDHGYSLTSIAKGYIRTQDPSYVDSIVKAADWALDKPLHSNINYLSALSKGLSYAYKVTGDARYLNKAIYFHEQGIFPNLSSETGGALDAHNQQLEYHGFIVSGIIALKLVIPNNHDFSLEVDKYLTSSVLHMQQRDAVEDGEYGSTWPGTNLLAWHELENIRPLTMEESLVKGRCASLINNYEKFIVEESGFRLQKSLYSNFFIGLYDGVY